MLAADFVDRINYRFTPLLCLFLAAVLCYAMNKDGAVQCWTPAAFSPAMEQYAEMKCRSEQTHFVLDDKSIYRERTGRRVSLFLLTSVLLVLQAAMAVFPRICWKIANALLTNGRPDVESFAAMSREASPSNLIAAFNSTGNSDQKDSVEKIAHLLYDQMRRSTGSSLVSVIFILIKILAVVICLFQIGLMSSFLQFDNAHFGWDIMKDIVASHEWNQSLALPQVILCDFEVRIMGNVHSHTVQCALNATRMAQNIFVMLWFWFIVLIIMNLMSALFWTYCTFFTSGRRRLFEKYAGRSVGNFALNTLGADGALCLKIMGLAGGPLVLSKIVDALVNAHYDKYQNRSTRPSQQVQVSNNPHWNSFGVQHRPQNGLFDRQNAGQPVKNRDSAVMLDNKGKNFLNDSGSKAANHKKPMHTTYPLNAFDTEDEFMHTTNIYPSAPIEDFE